MSRAILDLQNSANWQLIWGTSVTAATDANGRLFPIPPLTCPIRLESHTIAIFSSTPTGKQSWKVGGSVARKITTGVSGSSGADMVLPESKLFRLNQFALYRFNQLTTDYELELSPKWWLPDATLAVYAYTGIDIDPTTAQLQDINDKLDELV